MNRAVPGAMLGGLLLAGCGGGPDGLEASDVSILAPLPGQDTAVAYLTLTNDASAPVEITDVSSPEFTSVEMHATVFDSGIAQMLMIDSLTIAADSSIEFTTGGRHLMLADPLESLAPGDDVTLEFHYGAAEPFQVRAPIESRGLGDH